MCPNMSTSRPFHLFLACPESNLGSDRVGVEAGLLESTVNPLLSWENGMKTRHKKDNCYELETAIFFKVQDSRNSSNETLLRHVLVLC